jgi:RecB family exonuclease
MLVERYSISALDTFRKCPLQFKLKYIERVRVPTGIEAFMGSCVHKALEMTHPQLESEGEVDAKVLKEAYESAWHAGIGKEEIVIVRDDRDLEWYFETGLKGARWYVENYEHAGPTVFAELALEFKIDGIPFITVPDRVTNPGQGKFVIHDYKTSASTPSGPHFKSDRQLPLYQHALQLSVDGVEDVELVWHYVCLGQRYKATKTKDEVQAVLGSIMRDVREIEATDEFVPKTSPLCRWCFYWERCSAKRFKQRAIIDGHVVE